MDTNTPTDEDQEFPQLRFLRVLVTTLAGVMILGLLVLITLIVIRFQSDPAPMSLTLPDTVVLPEGVTAAAITAGQGWYAIVTDTDEILIFALDGSEMQRISITPTD